MQQEEAKPNTVAILNDGLGIAIAHDGVITLATREPAQPSSHRLSTAERQPMVGRTWHFSLALKSFVAQGKMLS